MPDQFLLSEELEPVLAKYLHQRAPVAGSREQGPGLPSLWSGLVEEVGVVGLLVPESLGGQGAGLIELGATVREAGRAGWSGPLVATAGVAAALLGELDPGDTSGLRADIAAGRVIVPALSEDLRGEGLATTATWDGERLSGQRLHVDSGAHADTFLVPARDGDEDVLIAVAHDAPGVTVTAQDATDPGRGIAMLALVDAPGHVVARGPQLKAALNDAWLVGAVLVAADALGAAERAFELAREYADTREQFGRAIGTFQAVKHKLVEMYAELELSRSAVREALRQAHERRPEWRVAVSCAASVVGDGTFFVLREAIQVHGGIGFTWEHELTHHFRRVMACRALYGTPAAHRRTIADARGLM